MRKVGAALLVASLALSSGCGLLGVEMTSTPATVKSGDPVTFNIKLTNYSACPLNESVAELVAFIPESEFQEMFFGNNPNLPPEIQEIVQELMKFFDELCAGGTPTPPEIPDMATSCRRGNNELVCEASGPAPGHVGGSSTGSGKSLGCTIDDETVHCALHLPLQRAQAGTGSTAALPPTLQCLPFSLLGVGPDSEALCFLGTFPDFEGLGPNGSASGQLTLTARGSGNVRNLVFAIGGDIDDAGVCKGGADGGQACEQGSSDCPGSSCGEGICQGGDRNGFGCDVSTQAADCPNGGTCKACDDVPDSGFLPVDCTTTYISPSGVPAMSPLGIVAIAVVMLVFGMIVLRRRQRA